MNNSTVIIDFENHRSRERIKDMGEVFTPEQYVQQMLNTLDLKIWTDENVIFFEPSCGHGNIVLPIFMRRVKELKGKYEKADADKPIFHALANALNTLWAIDICSKNIELTRKRLFELTLKSLKEANHSLYQARTREFVAHVLCTLVRQIHENEALSAIGHLGAENQTRLGREWTKMNNPKPINFQSTWCEYFSQSKKNKVEPIEFQRAIRFVESSLELKNVRGFDEFSFAKTLIQSSTLIKRSSRVVEGVA